MKWTRKWKNMDKIDVKRGVGWGRCPEKATSMVGLSMTVDP